MLSIRMFKCLYKIGFDAERVHLFSHNKSGHEKEGKNGIIFFFFFFYSASFPVCYLFWERDGYLGVIEFLLMKRNPFKDLFLSPNSTQVLYRKARDPSILSCALASTISFLVTYARSFTRTLTEWGSRRVTSWLYCSITYNWLIKNYVPIPIFILWLWDNQSSYFL